MNITRKPRVKKGVALIFALFTIAILFSISTTVVALSLHDSRATRVANYNDAALHAANWGIEAAINYMGQPGLNFIPGTSNVGATSQWVNLASTSFGTGRNLVLTEGDNLALNGQVNVKVSSLSGPQLKKDFGLDYSGKILGEDRWQSNHEGKDSTTFNERHGSDSRLINFRNKDKEEEAYRLKLGNGDNYAEVEVVCTEFRYPNSNQPSQYQLLSVARVFANDGNVADNDRVPLATRVVEARVRESVACDFMHFIQNARSWDVLGMNLGESYSEYDKKVAQGRDIARSAVFLPEGYVEAGRLRIDGYADDDPEENAVKKYLHNYNNNVLDGKLAFFSPDGFKTNKYIFQGDVTTAQYSKNYEYKDRKGGEVKTFAQGNKSTKNLFNGSLRDGVTPLGLPQIDDYFGKVRKTLDKNDGKTPMEFTVASGKSSGKVREASDINAPKSAGTCPDIAQANTYVTRDGKKVKVPSATPTFATVRVEIKGNKVKVLKYNSAITKGMEPGAAIDPDYVQVLQPETNINNIRAGIISVQGGNVEVVNVQEFSKEGKGLTSDYIDSSKTSGNKLLNGALTVVANVDRARDVSLNDVDYYDPKTDRADPAGGSSLYSYKARKYYDANPYDHVPPFSQKQLGMGSSKVKNIWPTPQSSSMEREGNAFLTSDIAYDSSNTGATKLPTLGVVAKNFILLNDKSINSRVKNTPEKKNQLRIDAVLMSMDHSVQFDWSNMAANSTSNYQELIANRGKDEHGRYMGPHRTFKLNGAIVSGFLDTEGDTNGRGYYNQKFSHDENLRYNLPPCFPRWEIGSFAGKGIFGDYMVIAYEDKGAISDL